MGWQITDSRTPKAQPETTPQRPMNSSLNFGVGHPAFVPVFPGEYLVEKAALLRRSVPV